MNLFSRKLLTNVYDLDSAGCVHHYLIHCPAIQESWNAHLDMTVRLLLSMGIGGALVYLLRMRWHFAINRYYVLLLFLAFNAIIYVLVIILYNSKMLYWLSFSVLLIQERISNGNWETLYCTLNAVAKCHPMGPISCIMDFIIINYYWVTVCIMTLGLAPQKFAKIHTCFSY